MNDIDITLYLNEYRVRALAYALGNQTAETVEDKLTEAFDTLYQEYVPDEQRASIEARIEREDTAEQAQLEAARRFAVYHIRENGDDCHFTSDIFRSPMQAAYRYRLYERGELSADPKTFADAFIETNPVNLEYFGKVCADIHTDDRVTALLEFDLDEGRVSVCDGMDMNGRPTPCVIFPLRPIKHSAPITEARKVVVKYSIAALQEKNLIFRKNHQMISQYMI